MLIQCIPFIYSRMLIHFFYFCFALHYTSLSADASVRFDKPFDIFRRGINHLDQTNPKLDYTHFYLGMIKYKTGELTDASRLFGMCNTRELKSKIGKYYISLCMYQNKEEPDHAKALDTFKELRKENTLKPKQKAKLGMHMIKCYCEVAVKLRENPACSKINVVECFRKTAECCEDILSEQDSSALAKPKDNVKRLNEQLCIEARDKLYLSLYLSENYAKILDTNVKESTDSYLYAVGLSYFHMAKDSSNVDKKTDLLRKALTQLESYRTLGTQTRLANVDFCYARTLLELKNFEESRKNFELLLAKDSRILDEEYLKEFDECQVEVYAAKSVFYALEYATAQAMFAQLKAKSMLSAEQTDEVNYYWATCQIATWDEISWHTVSKETLKEVYQTLVKVEKKSPLYAYSRINQAICLYMLDETQKSLEILDKITIEAIYFY